MMELVDMRDLGSRAAMRWGSSPHARTKDATVIPFELRRHLFYARYTNVPGNAACPRRDRRGDFFWPHAAWQAARQATALRFTALDLAAPAEYPAPR